MCIYLKISDLMWLWKFPICFFKGEISNISLTTGFTALCFLDTVKTVLITGKQKYNQALSHLAELSVTVNPTTRTFYFALFGEIPLVSDNGSQ